jgi:hypothetical protein
MNPLVNAINFILRGEKDKFKNVLNEALIDRATDLMEKQAKSLEFKGITPIIVSENTKPVIQKQEIKFMPQSSYLLRDGTSFELNKEQQVSISKLYESLNNNNKERLVKLLSESQESIKRIINLAKINDRK